MKISNNGLALIKRYEGLRLTAYRDAVGIPTIGYGHIKGVKMGQTITEEQATEYLRQDVADKEKAVDKYTALYNFNQDMFDALVSFAFNVGTGNLNKLVKNGARSSKEIGDHITDFNKARVNGVLKELAGLTRRRKEEQALYLRGLNGAAHEPTKPAYPLLKKGARGDEVKLLQSLLNAKGYELAVDGIFGTQTEQAVRFFQADHIDICRYMDGICGRLTWSALTL